MSNNLIDITFSLFENIKHFDNDGNEFWYARELMLSLDYKRWDKFSNVINGSIENCRLSNVEVLDHFSHVGKMVEIGSGTKRKLDDYKLSRYACYLIAQNSDSRKEVVALAKTYFAIQTRKQELFKKDYNLLSEDQKRLNNRNIVKKGNISLNKVASKSGVRKFETFTNAGYKVLYNGETAADIAKRKNLCYREEILDHMSSAELALNIFRISQTEQELINKNIDNEYDANSTHYNVGKDIREFVKKHGGTMPEDMKMPISSTKDINKINNKNNNSKEFIP